MAKKKQETKNNKKEKKEEVIKEEKIVKEKDKKGTKKETKKVKKNNDDKVLKIIEFFDKYRLAIYGAVGGILLTILVVIIIWPDRIATLKDGTQPVAEINDYTVTADILYEDMKEVYSISSLLDKIDNKILEEKYPETEEMNDELKQQAESYYSAYEQYYQMDKETFLSNNGFGSEKAFLEYLRLQYRRNKYAEDYIKTLISDKDVEKDKQDKPKAVKKARKIIKTRITKQEHIGNAEKAEPLAEQEHNDQTVASPVKNEANEPQLPQTGEANTSVIGLLGMLVAGFAAILGFESSRSRKHKN